VLRRAAARLKIVAEHTLHCRGTLARFGAQTKRNLAGESKWAGAQGVQGAPGVEVFRCSVVLNLILHFWQMLAGSDFSN